MTARAAHTETPETAEHREKTPEHTHVAAEGAWLCGRGYMGVAKDASSSTALFDPMKTKL